MLRDNAPGITAATAPDLGGLRSRRVSSASRAPADTHRGASYGRPRRCADRRGSAHAPSRLNDGLPETLREVIAAHGHRYFKLKVSGRPARGCRATGAHRRRAGRRCRRLPGHARRQRAVRKPGGGRGFSRPPRRGSVARPAAQGDPVPRTAAAARGDARRCRSRRLAGAAAGRDRRGRRRDRRLSRRARARLHRRLGEVLQGLLPRAAQPRPCGEVERRNRRRAAISCPPRT